jgi:mRNA interferase RelE/StbE
MNYLVEYEPEALADLEKLTKSVCQRIVNKINWLAENFDQITPQPLTADLSSYL